MWQDKLEYKFHRTAKNLTVVILMEKKELLDIDIKSGLPETRKPLKILNRSDKT